jgi:2-C-methyl-D-erythritol 4-phosphate cytidylyltransferase
VSVSAVVVAGAPSAHVDLLMPVRGVPMVVLAVRALLAAGVVREVSVLDLDGRRPALERACAGLPVRVRARAPVVTVGQRACDPYGDGSLATRENDVVLLHDAARPLAPASLATAVVDAVERGHEMAVPVLPVTDTVKRVDPDGMVIDTPDRAGMRVLQTPIALRAGLVPADLAVDPLDVVRRHTATGGLVHAVPGHPAAFPVRSEWELELAQLLAEGTISP